MRTLEMAATEKQVDFIENLLDQKAWAIQPAANLLDAYIEGESITRGQASTIIDFLKSCPRRPTPVAERAELGYYVLRGDVFVVVANKTKTGTYAKRMVLDLEARRGRWEYAKGFARAFASQGMRPLSPEEAAKLSKQHGCCVLCGRTLTDPASVERGIGPVCRKRVAESHDRLTATDAAAAA